MLISLISFYKLSFLVAGVSAPCLALMGKHFFARSTILEIFLLSQMALLGNLFGALFLHDENTFLSILISFTFFLVGKVLISKITVSSEQKGNLMIGGYLFLLSFQYLLIGIFPTLDSHMNVGLFGNMVTASSEENLIIICTCLLFLCSYRFFKRNINRRTLELSLLRVEDKSIYEGILFTVPLVIALYSLSFLYTLSFLLLPALIIGNIFKSEKKASLFIMIIASIASLVGLLLSISFERVGTTSAQILILCLLLIFVRIFRIKNKR